MREDWVWKDGWPEYDPNANKECKTCNGTGIIFHIGVFSFEEECSCCLSNNYPSTNIQ
jgi:DnaJ-class molecular chaperone